MKNKLLLLFILLFILCTFSVETFAQNENVTQIRAYITKANVALTNSDWDSALENVDEAQKLAGRNVAAFELIRVRVYQGNKQYAMAKQSLETFYTLSPNQTQINEVAPYSAMIDDGIQEEKERLARKEREEQRRIEAEKKRQAEREAYQKKLDAIIVLKEGMSAGNKMRDQVWSALFNKSAVQPISVTFRTVVSHDYWGNPEYDDVTLSDNLRIQEARLSGTDFGDYAMSLEYAVNSTRDCRRINRYEGRNFFLNINFTPSSDEIRIRHNVDIEIPSNLFGCTGNRPIESREDFTRQVERFISDFIEGNANRLRDISLSETEQLAMKKDRDSFMRYFMQRVTSDRKWTYQQMIDQREADRIAAEQAAERRRLEEIKAEQEEQRKASYDDLLSAYYAAGRGLDTSEQDFSPMLKKFEEHVSTYPEDEQGLNLYAYFLANADRDLEKALAMALKANEINPGQAHILDTVGWVYTRQENYEEAREYLTEAYETDSTPTIDLIRHLITAHYASYNTLVNDYDGEHAVKYAKYAKANEMDIPLADRVISFLCPAHRACSDTYWIEQEYKGKWLVSFMKVTSSENKYQGLRKASNMSEVYETIEEIEDDSYLIDLEYGDDTWHMTLQGGFSGDTKILSKSSINLLSEEIEQYWNSSYHLIDIEYALGKWYAVMLNDEDYPLDGYSYNSSGEKFTEAIRSRSEEGYRLTAMEFGNGFYFGVFIKEPNTALSWNDFSTQAGLDSFMSSKIEDDYAIFYGSAISDTEYLAIAEKPNSNSNHDYVYFPNIEMIWYDIEKYWEDGYLIKNIEYQK